MHCGIFGWKSYFRTRPIRWSQRNILLYPFPHPAVCTIWGMQWAKGPSTDPDARSRHRINRLGVVTMRGPLAWCGDKSWCGTGLRLNSFCFKNPRSSLCSSESCQQNSYAEDGTLRWICFKRRRAKPHRAHVQDPASLEPLEGKGKHCAWLRGKVWHEWPWLR